MAINMSMIQAIDNTATRCHSVSVNIPRPQSNKRMLFAHRFKSTKPGVGIFLLQRHRPINFSSPKIF
jgi:hypothetical protein